MYHVGVFMFFKIVSSGRQVGFSVIWLSIQAVNMMNVEIIHNVLLIQGFLRIV